MSAMAVIGGGKPWSIFARVFNTVVRIGLIGQFMLGGPPSLAVTWQESTSSPGNLQTERGLHVASFDTLNGRVVVNLPDDLSAGDTISGTVEALPAGKQPEEIAKNQDQLNGLVVEIAETKVPAKDQTTKIQVPETLEKILLIVRNQAGKEVGSVAVPVHPKAAVPDCGKQEGKSITDGTSKPSGQQSASGCPFELPMFGQPGRTIEIRGPFTGDALNTGVKIGGKDTKVLAESPRKVLTQVPSDLVGATDIEVIEKNRSVAKGEFRSLGIKLSAGKLALLKGEQTTLTATVFGLQGLKETVSLGLENKSPAVVTLEGGNVQTLTIAPGQVAGGQATLTRTLTGIQPGGFSISALVETPLRRVTAPPSAAQVTPGTSPRTPQSCHIIGPVIPFEDLPAGHPVGSDYNFLGVRFNNPPHHFTDNHAGMADSLGLPSIFARASQTSSPRQALQAANCHCSEQYGAGPMEIDFNIPQSDVSMMVGFLGTSPAAPASPQRRLILRAYDAAGNHVDSASDLLSQDNSITHCLRVGMGSPRIVKVVLDQEIYPGDLDWDFAIDDLTYNQAPAITSEGTYHTLTIINPPWDTITYSSPGTVTALIFAPDFRPGWHIDEVVSGADWRHTFRDIGSLTGGYPYYRYTVPTPLETGTNQVRLALVDPSAHELANDQDELILRPPLIHLSVRAKAIEVTQALSIPQVVSPGTRGATLQHAGVPLVQNKNTVVRVYADVYASTSDPLLIPAVLYGYDDFGAALPGSPINPILGPRGAADNRIIDNHDALIDQRLNPGKSWNFLLPASWTNSYSIRLRAVINPDASSWSGYTGDMTDEITLNNVRFFQTSSLQINAYYYIGHVPGDPASGDHWNHPSYDQYSGPRDPAFTNGWINSVMPVPHQSLTVIPDRGGGFDSCIGTALFALGDCFAFGDLFNNLSATAWLFAGTNATEGFNPPYTPYVFHNTEIVAQPTSLTNGTLGMALIGSHSFASEVNAWWSGGDASHEMMHDLGMNHAGHAHDERGVESGWPTCHGSIGLTCVGSPDTSTTSLGATDPARVLAFDTAPRQGNLAAWATSQDATGVYIVKDPAAHAPYPFESVDCPLTPDMHYHELLSYGTRYNGNRCDLGPWVSPINYCRIFFKLSGAQTAGHDDPSDYCLARLGLLSAGELSSIRAGFGLRSSGGQGDAQVGQSVFLTLPVETEDPVSNLSADDQPAETMLVMAFDHPKRPLLIAPTIVRDFRSRSEQKNDQNGYFARLLDADGRVLLETAMNTTPVSDHADPGKTFLAAQLPVLPQAAALRLVRLGKDGKETEIGKVQRPPGHPQVKITSPVPGSEVAPGAAVVLQWSGTSDPTGATRYSVSFSSDGGKTFHDLQHNLRSRMAKIPVANLGGGYLSFRVIAENGFEASTDQVDKVKVPVQPPLVTILEPKDGSSFTAAAHITLAGQAFDPQSGPLKSSQLEWVSDLMGVLGKGGTLELEGLPPGSHRLTLRARGAVSGEASVTVTVERNSHQPRELRSGTQ